MKKIIQILLVLLFNTSIWAQIDYSNKWEDFYSYNNVKDFIKIDENIYSIVDNAVFIHNLLNGENSKLSSVNGLSGEETSCLFYSKANEKLIIGYETGLIEIVDKKNNISIAKDIVNFNYSGDKRINNIYEYGDKLYISTAFAIIEYNIKDLQFGDTFFIGDQSSEIKVNQVKVNENVIYAVTENGIFTADVSSPNLIDFNSWNQYFTGNFSAIEIFNGQVYVSKGGSLYKFYNNQLQLVKNFQTIKKLNSSKANLAITTQRAVYILNSSDIEEFRYSTNSSQPFYANFNTSFFEDNLLYIATQEFGLLKSTKEGIPNFEEIHPMGPTSNLPFSISVKNENLWVVYGAYDGAYAPRNLARSIDHFNGDNWINIPYKDFKVTNLVNVTFDPDNINKVFISSYGNGMLVVENNIITDHWTHLNSGLEWRTRINGSAFDKDGNLWIANSWVDKRLKKYSADGTWDEFDMSSIMTSGALGLGGLIVDNANNIWIGSRRNGALVFNENGEKKRALVTEQTKGSLPDPNVRAIQADENNRVWIGTLKGLVVLYNAANVLSDLNIDAEPVIILNDSGIAKKLLGDQPVNTIAIDGANNKWFGTSNGGVLMTNPDGKTTLHNFNVNNSPLPSNAINKIEIDKESGKVYFATSKGIVAFNSDVAEYGESLTEVYAYPNPSTKNNEFITIDGRNGAHLPKGTNLKIVDTAGNLVFETNVKEGEESSGGKIIWNKTNLAGRKVASGVYIVLLIDSERQKTSIAKIAIIN
ncbi:type IX secretion system anionic LPS delivery protein PorZ [Lutibacter citreus]|uniref:type IX secretion system anionic LPS delivery protein PorZ n=1 Tax=Lutibacter citreus TaxID=2138210 RepID=UPI000DBEA11D|nr:two-component regulator propeller domain-containing protein [Lutibacter citreus]